MKTSQNNTKTVKRGFFVCMFLFLILPALQPLDAQISSITKEKAPVQATTVEIFHPNTEKREQKEVRAFLPFHKQSKLVSMEFVDGMAIIEGDIILGPSQLYNGDTQPAIAIDGDSYRWKDGVIPYTIESGHPRANLIQQGIEHIHEQTNLRLVPRNGENDYVKFINDDGCSSWVGRCGGKQEITIGNCGRISIVHEILHAAGLWHEQSREDRNEHITILWDNIEPDEKHNFKRHVSDGIDIGIYDCNSIMHYSAMAFSKNGQPTIVSNSCENIGQRIAMSGGDIAAISELYPVAALENLRNRPWFLVAGHSVKAISIKNGGLVPKVNVQQSALDGSTAQKFRFLPAGGEYYYINNIESNLMLDVQGGNATSPTNVWQYAKNSTDAQKWRLIAAGNDYYYIRSKLGDLNLEVQGGSMSNGGNVIVASITGAPAQQFKLKKAVHTPPSDARYASPLEQYWNASRKDNFTTASRHGKNNAVNGNYRYVRVDGYVLNKPTTNEGETTPLYLFYHDVRKDNFTTASAEGIRAAEAGGYRNAGIEGYVLKSVSPQYKHLYKPLWLYYHDTRKDNFVAATQQGMTAAEDGGYRKVRIEGYVRIR